MATDMITVTGCKVRYMYREEKADPSDTGWRFLAGTEDQAYADTPDNWGYYDINTIANYDPSIIPYLDSEPAQSHGKDVKTLRFSNHFYS